ncbi:MAG: HEAT repeat domain-containing protein [Lentisphaeria bacterium]|jgi:HEAT repeat protein|nr:HEAT repeat domain-containing protein [Lentisphaeria bacterium]
MWSDIYPCVRCAGAVFCSLAVAVAIAAPVPAPPAAVPGQAAEAGKSLDNHVKEGYAKIAAAQSRGEDVTEQVETLRRFIGERSLTDGEAVGPDKKSENETVRECLEQIRSDSADVRLRAVTVLGKYHSPAARDGVVNCLGDESEAVRQSALVALTERRPRNFAGVWQLSNLDPVIRLFGDPSVHIRRTATSAIPDFFVYGLGRRRARVFSKPSQEFIIAAYNDDDVTVRKNMVTYHWVFKLFVPPEMLIERVNDVDRDVRVLALKSCRSAVKSELFVPLVQHLTNDEDRIIRLQLALILGRGGLKDAEPVLQTLAADEDFEVSTEASCALFRLSRQKNLAPLYQDVLRPRLDDPRIHSTTAVKVIQQLHRLDVKTRESALRELMQHDNGLYRYEALRKYCSSLAATMDVGLVFGLLDDASRKVRDTASRQLSKKRFAPTPEQQQQLLKNRYADVRKSAVQMTRTMAKVMAEPFLMDLLLDDRNDVRYLAVSEIGRRRIGDWVEILEATTTDDDRQMRALAVKFLFNSRTPQSQAVIEDIRNSDDAELKKILSEIMTKKDSRGRRILTP